MLKSLETVEQAHVGIGHPSEEATQKTAEALNWILTKETLKPCKACAATKTKQKNIPKA
jgi:UDP:flavonoid glycosyltransferase YjiC (YdhE family)